MAVAAPAAGHGAFGMLGIRWSGDAVPMRAPFFMPLTLAPKVFLATLSLELTG